ncbi:histone-like nucleoid-structuring protein Lsr2 [Streptomyces sp. NPDC017260]|uniref:histone-like nucleoid-structuring protein Lsr2 n=1 Tax=unclassified Streptomyces TaxID=2593676 RepID=UPI0037A13810
MATKRIVTLIDDLDPNGEVPADETVTFALDGKHYEIDLAAGNAHTLRARLKTFIQAGRLVKASTPRSTQSATPHAPAGQPTENRHQNGDNPADIRAWARKEGLQLPTKGRLPKKLCAAYRAAKFNNRGPLQELLNEQNDQPTTPDPAKPLQATPAPPEAPSTEPTPKGPAADPTPGNEDPNEAEAKKRYIPLTHLSPDAQKKKWANRTAHGCERTDKVADMTLMERITAIGNGGSDRNLTILGMLAGVVPLKNGKVSYLSGSCIRLENLEMIQYAPGSDHGWEITDFGRFAHQHHSMG